MHADFGDTTVAGGNPTSGWKATRHGDPWHDRAMPGRPVPRAVLGALLFVLSAGPARSGAVAPAPTIERVRRVQLPVYLVPEEPGGCRAITADSVEITEDGWPLEALHLDAGRLPAEHAVLIDSGQRMLAHLQAVKQTAIRYVRSLPDGEPALLASLDDDLVLHSPMTADRARFEQRAEEMSIGFHTRLWDGVRQLADYLASRQRRSVLILLSDGCDSGPRSEAAFAGALEAVARSADLTVFPIGLRPPARCGGDGSDPRQSLRELARTSGGSSHDVDAPERIGDVLSRIRDRLADERFVSYAPPPFGGGPHDRTGERRSRWRRVEVRLRGRHACRIHLASGSQRLESAPGTGPSGPPQASFVYDAATESLRATLTDVLRDDGLVARRGLHAAVRISRHEERQEGLRQVAAWVPPLERVVRHDARPEHALFHALAQLTPEAIAVDLPGIEDGISHWTEASFLTGGRTLLDNRLAFGRALAGHPDYRAWASEALRGRRLGELDEVGARTLDAQGREELAAIREFITGPGWRPAADELAPYLAEWLGDVPALRVHGAAEALLIERLLRAARSSERRAIPPEWVERNERLWHNLGFLLAEAREVRIFGLLVPGYDPVEDRLGFYRIVLPRPTTLVNVWHPSPEAPRGLHLMEWALGQPEFREAMESTRLSVAEVRYEAVSADSTALSRLAGLGVREGDASAPVVWVQVRLATPGRPTEWTDLRGLFAYHAVAGVPPTEPLCVEIPRSAETAVSEPLAAFVRAKATSAFPCIIEAGARQATAPARPR